MKKIISTLCVFSMVFMLFAECFPPSAMEVQAATYITNPSDVRGSDFSSTYAEKLDNIFSGRASLFSDTSAGFAVGSSLDNSKDYWVADTIFGRQCYIYAQGVYYYLFGDIPYHGDGIGNYWRNSRRVLTNLSSASYQTFSDAGVGFGAYIRTTPNSDGSYNGNSGHSLVVLSYNSSGITYIEGNANRQGLVQVSINSWSEFNSRQLSSEGRRICHVVQYNATAGSQCSCSTSYAGEYLCTTSGIGLNIRSGHGTSYGNIGTIPPNAIVSVSKASGTSNSDWAHVTYNGVSGYASMQYLRNIKQDSDNLGTSFYATISNVGSGLYVTNDTTNISVRSANGSKNQIWLFEKQSNGCYSIRSATDMLCMDVDGGGTTNGTNVKPYPYDGNYAQLWYVTSGSKGYTFTSKRSGLVLDVNNNESAEGTNVQTWEYNATDAQYFNIHTISDLNSSSTNDAVISKNGGIKYYAYTPTTSTKYVIYSIGSEDAVVYLYDATFSELARNDDDGEGRNFRLEYDLTAGNKYIFGVKYYSSSDTGTIAFKFGKVYTISYDANGGTNAPAPDSKDYGKTVNLSNTVPTRSGYTFMGWSTGSSSTSAAYHPNDEFSINTSITFYAVWQINTYTVTLTDNGDGTATITAKLPSGVASGKLVIDVSDKLTYVSGSLSSTSGANTNENYTGGTLCIAFAYTNVLDNGTVVFTADFIINGNTELSIDDFMAPQWNISDGSVKLATEADGDVIKLYEKKEYLIGDANGDKYVDNLDAALVLKFDAGIIGYDALNLIASDVNADGYVDNLDSAWILKYDAGLIADLNK